ncbi:hypothetical protein JTE90_022028 [Oedothorax gibbosus]|uniref:Protein FAM92A n=1 Tax=Oedothorax gibbosus TaxID=931172 RepID=A0AAV6V3I8_9ARAC|nr:hypothetical protein JTE90_022028 [Oedothorax gibbosus]
MALDLRSSELEHSFIKDRISVTEKHFSEISSKLAAYLKKLSQVRDSGDDLAGSVTSYASTENLNLSLRKYLMQFADILKAIQEYRDAEIQRIDVKVALEFSNYKPICKTAKSELKASFDLHAKELSMKNQLEKTRGKNPTNWQKIAQVEKEACRIQDEATRTTLELSKRIDNFEQRKIQDVKNTFLEFMKIELVFHAKAIELYTDAYNSIKNINVDEDLKEFRSHFRSYTTSLASNNIQVEDQIESVNSNCDTNKTVGPFAISNSGFKDSLESKVSPHITSTPKDTSMKKMFYVDCRL